VASSGLVSLVNTSVQIAFLAVGSYGPWMNWLMVGVVPLAVLPLVFVRVGYDRLLLDVAGEGAGRGAAGRSALVVCAFDRSGY
jgi:hypothetical protein